MGQPVSIENDRVIDDTFVGLASAKESISIGRDDVDGERPGETLIAAVKKFEQDGGFKRIQEGRNETLAAAEAADEIERRNRNIEMDAALPPPMGHPEKEHDLGED